MKDKIQTNLEKAYNTDKIMMTQVLRLPWVVFGQLFRSLLLTKIRAMKYYEEYMATTKHTAKHDDERNLYVAELLIDKGGDANLAKAKTFIEKASKSSNSYYKSEAARLQKEIN